MTATGGGGTYPDLPHRFNAATAIIDRNLVPGLADKTAVIDEQGEYSYAELARLVNRTANALADQGIKKSDRVLMAMLDTVEFPAVFWGCIKSACVPIPLNTLLTTPEYQFILQDSSATALIVSESLYHKFEPILDQAACLKHIIISGHDGHGYPQLGDLLQTASPELTAADTRYDDIAFWLYSSGSTGKPKGVMHRHESLLHTAVLYGKGILEINEKDTVYSAAKLFFAYGLGNAMTFPFYTGATTVLYSGRPTPESVKSTFKNYNPTIYFGVPGLYAAILATVTHPVKTNLRLCVSAGEALPEHNGRNWEKMFGVPVLDGIGSTEMLHIYLSHDRENDYYGSTGLPVPGYSVKLVEEDGTEVLQGKVGELLVKGPSMASGYWRQDNMTRAIFRDEWLHSGDKYLRNKDGFYVYSGRKDDMFKVSGQWVSPFEIEATLMQHPAVLEAAVIARKDENDLLKPMAFVVLKDTAAGSGQFGENLKVFVKQRISLHKYPRWIEFVTSLPKTATGKIQRYKLRNQP